MINLTEESRAYLAHQREMLLSKIQEFSRQVSEDVEEESDLSKSPNPRLSCRLHWHCRDAMLASQKLFYIRIAESWASDGHKGESIEQLANNIRERVLGWYPRHSTSPLSNLEREAELEAMQWMIDPVGGVLCGLEDGLKEESSQ